MSDDTKVIADHYRRERAAAIAAGTIPIEDYTAEEARVAIAAIPDDEAREALSRSFSTGNDGPAGVPDISDEQLAAGIAANEERHKANRIERVRAPFEASYADDVQRYGADSPILVGNGVDARLRNAAAESTDKDRAAALREAVGWKPAPRESWFADLEVEGAESVQGA